MGVFDQGRQAQLKENPCLPWIQTNSSSKFIEAGGQVDRSSFCFAVLSFDVVAMVVFGDNFTTCSPRNSPCNGFCKYPILSMKNYLAEVIDSKIFPFFR
jgi:hypothetical protein